MKIGEIINRVIEAIGKGPENDDINLEKERIYNKLVSVRNMLLKQIANQSLVLDKENYSNICLELEQKDDACFSYAKIPDILFTNSGYMLDIPNASYVNFAIFLSMSNNTKYGDVYSIYNGYLYMITSKKKVEISAVLENPYSEYLCNFDKCRAIYDFDFRVQSDLIDKIVEISLQEFTIQTIEDETDSSNQNR